MTRKDYIKLANVIAESILDVKNETELDGVSSVYDKLINTLAQDNTRFSEDKFREYVRKQIEKGI